jgi:alkanesulfonate monooxygenase SsuD/methylene tetrahydromethanopterin reductase-like flavin-dependent oxidoreductase (luciferase family)
VGTERGAAQRRQHRRPLRGAAGDRFILGSPDDLIEAIEQLESELGVNHVAFRLQWPGLTEATPQDQVLNAIRLIGERVVPHFARRPATGIATL